MANGRSPLKNKPLRNPGQSVREQRVDLVFDKLMAPMMMAILMVVWAAMEWLRYYWPSPRHPWIMTIIALGAAGYAAWQSFRVWPKIQMLRQAEEGEKAVGQFLEGLRGAGYQVFHDLIGGDFNVDHVLIGETGIYTIETKTWSKPLKGKPSITFDGDSLLVAGRAPDRNPVIQAKAQASWLQRLLAESTGRMLPTRPVVLFPGWFIEDSRSSRKDLWVLEPKALPSFLAQETPMLASEDVKLAAFHLSRFIREQERLLEAKK